MTNDDLVDLYLRLSVDREGKDSLERQEADLRVWADREGKTVRRVWIDAGKSGFKREVVRDDFEAAVRAVTSGEVGTLAVWKLDRLSRRGAGHVGTILDDLERASGRIVFLRDSLDSSDPAHRTMIILVSEQARTESNNTKLRVKSRFANDRSKGIPKAGTRSFGYEVDGMTIREAEAIHVREAVRFILEGGGSMLQVAKMWNAVGLKTDGMLRPRKGRDGEVRMPRGLWTATTVRSVLTKPRNAGILVHDGAELPDSQIQAIITREQLDALNARAKAGTPMGRRALSLLGGTIRCDCGEPMHSTISYSQRKGGPRREYRIYKCSATLYDKTRTHASIQEHIADAVAVRRLAEVIAVDGLEDDSPAESGRLTAVYAALADLTGREERAEDALLEGLGDPKRMKGRLAQIKAQRTELQAERDRLQADRVGVDVLARAREYMRARVAFARAVHPSRAAVVPWSEVDEAIRSMAADSQAWAEAFGDMDPATRQGLIRAKLTITCHPAATHGRGAGRLEITPR